MGSNSDNRWANRIRLKQAEALTAREWEERLDKAVGIIRGLGSAFRDTVDAMEKDFKALTERVEKLEKKDDLST